MLDGKWSVIGLCNMYTLLCLCKQNINKNSRMIWCDTWSILTVDILHDLVIIVWYDTRSDITVWHGILSFVDTSFRDTMQTIIANSNGSRQRSPVVFHKAAFWADLILALSCFIVAKKHEINSHNYADDS